MISISQIAKTIKSQSKFWIVFTGDSITSTEWVHPNWREIVEYVLKEELTKEMYEWKAPSWGIRTFNFAYDGATTSDILDRVDLIKQVHPDLVISVMGSNDHRKNIDVSLHIENIKKIIDKLDTNVVWCTSIPANDSNENQKYEPYAKATMQIAQNERLQFIDMFPMYKKFPIEKFFTFKLEEIPSDGVKKGDPDILHPNQLGNAYLAKIILKEVFLIEFDPETYIKDTLGGEKYPSY
jgi:lysophospholipase L1-like esterase